MVERNYAVLDDEANSESMDVAAEWQMCTVGELTDNFDALRIPVRQRERQPGPYPYYGASGIVDYVNGFLFNGQYLLIAEDGENLRTRTTPIAFLANGKFWVNNHAHIVRGNGNADTRFLMYALAGLDISGYLTGSTMPKLTQGNMNRIELLTPTLPEQRAIAHVLGTLDDKIDLNRRMNETLEGMARALFKSWFVDFEPVRAKMEGRWRRGESLPGMPAELYDLFPGRLLGSEVGEVPEGWEVRGLDSIATFLNGLALQKYPATDGSALPVIKIAQLRAGHTIGADSASSDLPPQYVVHDRDVLFSWSGSLELDIWSGGEGALNQHLFKVTSEEYPQWLYYRWVREHLPGFREIAAGKATTMGHIQRHHLSEALAVIPDAATLKAMDRYMSPLVDRSLAFRIESCRLATQRDALLPRLVSGEVGVGVDSVEQTAYGALP